MAQREGEEGLVPLCPATEPSSQTQRNFRQTAERQIPHSPSGEQILSEWRGYERYESLQRADIPVRHHNIGGEVCESDDAITFTVPTRLLARFNFVMLLLAYTLVERECVLARHFLRRDNGSYTSPVSKWKVAEGHDVPLRVGTAAGSEIVAVLRSGDVCYIYGEELKTSDNTIRAHVIAPKNGWATFSLATSNPPLELVNNNLSVSFCPLVASGSWYSDTSLMKQAPTAIVVSQQLWNAAQVGQLFLLLCLYVTMSNVSIFRMIVSGTFIGLAVIMPFSVYVTSPGAASFATISFLTAAFAAVKASDVRVTLMDLPPRVFGGRMEYTRATIVMYSLFKVEFIACLCNLFSSMYNYNGSKIRFPYWDHIYRSLDGLIGLVGKTVETNMDALNQVEYTIGLDVQVPLFVPSSYGSTVGSLVFLTLWCWIPFVYVLYFGAMFVSSVKAPGKRIQQALSALGIFHFLFLTDVVAYRYGRGVLNPGDTWFHFMERICWRIAILLPIYQNVMTAHWKHGNRISWVGHGLHYFFAIWTVPFFLNDGLRLARRIFTTIRGTPSEIVGEVPGWYILGYFGALVLQAVVYFCMVIGWSSCHHIFAGQLSACNNKSRTKPDEHLHDEPLRD